MPHETPQAQAQRGVNVEARRVHAAGTARSSAAVSHQRRRGLLAQLRRYGSLEAGLQWARRLKRRRGCRYNSLQHSPSSEVPLSRLLADLWECCSTHCSCAVTLLLPAEAVPQSRGDVNS